ncbi:hypothetical protein CONLIGDRAFT_630114 [Coniochaeta ligniaria NRRL 30616]|uniref:Secreted protein n=1 Tax=Coniochaeta ligniaria NRRL 30616 TaxID=1408157 RepID=A0A1J7IY62_9PEZI|nr:hypothetical protein CONLIGDRAFT_630114 [Coniochaeta ligniaria NRRL 30616]
MPQCYRLCLLLITWQNLSVFYGKKSSSASFANPPNTRPSGLRDDIHTTVPATPERTNNMHYHLTLPRSYLFFEWTSSSPMLTMRSVSVGLADRYP